MDLFNKKFVHFMWTDELEGKEGFFADNASDLQDWVNSNEEKWYGKCHISDNERYPFNNCTDKVVSDYQFFYYDPHLEIKRAFLEGKQIQYKLDGDPRWYDTNDSDLNDIKSRGLSWFDDTYEYRIKPEEPEQKKRMTYRQLAEWLAKGKGQYRTERSIGAHSNTYVSVYTPNENNEVNYVWEIRRWGSDEWVEPTVDVYNVDVKGI